MGLEKPSLLEIFATAGQEYGLEIWRIEDFEMVAVPKKCYGQFYTGDTYVILYTYEEDDEKKQNLHFWIGDESSQDEYGAAAIIVTQFDDMQDDLPVQYRETEDHESETFQNYFDHNIQYKEGGVASGFTHREVNEDTTSKMLKIKGRAGKVYAKEVPMSWDSFTCDDVYIIEVGAEIYRWKGEESNNFEWMQSSFIANSIRDNEQAGRGDIHEVEQGGLMPEDVIEALGPNVPEEYPRSKKADKDAQVCEDPTLYRISNDSGELEITEVAKGEKLDKDLLETGDCYILDCGAANVIYVWKGKKSNVSEKKSAMKTATKFIKQKITKRNAAFRS